VQRANNALPKTLPVPWRPPPPQGSNTMGEKSAHLPTGIGAHPTPLFPLLFQEGGGAASEDPTGDQVCVDYCQVHCKVPPPFPRLQQDVRWAESVLEMSSSRSCGTRD